MVERDPSRAARFLRRVHFLWQNPLVEFFSMRRRLAALHEQGFGPATPRVAQSQLAYTVLRDAHQIGNSKESGEAALILYRSAARLLMGAALDGGSAPSNADRAELWDRALEARLVKEPPSLQRALSSVEGESYLAGLSAEERAQILKELRALAESLSDRSFDDATLVARVLWTRRVRLALAALFVLTGFAWAVRGLVSPRNLALHRPVTVSNRERTYGVDPSRLVDGDELNLGFHTDDRPHATATIDLEAVRSLKRVIVHNRVDCCQERAVPLLLQLSSDGREFVTVSERDYRFQKWEVALPPNTRARYVRLLHNARGAFHLAEVEVY